MAVAFDAFSNVAAGTGTLSWTHTPVGTPRAVRVDIVENGGTNGVSSVTYGGVSMELVAVNAKSSGEAGTVITYFLGSNIPTGAQTVSVTVSDAVSKRAGAITLTASANTCWLSLDASIGSDSLANPTSTLNLLGKSCFVAVAGHSGQNAVTGTTPSAGWTSRLEHDFGNQCALWYTYDTISTANVACGWTQAADDAVMVALAITEAPLAVDTTAVQITESASVVVVFDSRSLPIRITESASVFIITNVSASDSTAVQVSEGSSTIGLVVSAADSTAVVASESATASTLTAQQALPVHLTDTATVTQVGVFLADSLPIKLSESVTLVSSAPQIVVPDTISNFLTESKPVVLADGVMLIVSTADQVAVQVSDVVANLNVFVPGATQNFVVSDALKVQLNGSGVAPISITASDSMRVTISEPSDQYGLFGVVDVGAVQLTEVATVNTGSLVAVFTVADTLAIQETETTTLLVATVLTASDSTRVQTVEDVPDVPAAIIASDALQVTITEPPDQFVHFGVVDSLAIQAPSEVSQITGQLNFAVTDSLAAPVQDAATLGLVVTVASEALGVFLAEAQLTNSATVKTVESLATGLTDLSTLFKTFAVTDTLSPPLSDIASPIFNNFVQLSTAETLAVGASESIAQLTSFLIQLTTADALASALDDAVTTQTITAVSSDAFELGLLDDLSVAASLTVSDTCLVGVQGQGLAIPIVPVSVTTFTGDTFGGLLDSASLTVGVSLAEAVAIGWLEDVVLTKAYPVTETCTARITEQVTLFVSQAVTDSAAPIGGDLATVTASYQVTDDVHVDTGEVLHPYQVVANASPDTWNGTTLSEHRNDKPNPWKYQFAKKGNW